MRKQLRGEGLVFRNDFVCNVRRCSNESGRKRTYVESENGTDTYLINVEQIALNHYKRNGFLKGVHCEGALLLTLFSVLFWDIIYDSKVPSAFINEIQYIPLDLYSEDFYSNRKKHIDKRLAEIREVWASDALLFFAMQNWEMNSRKRSLIVSDLVESVDELIEIMSCIGRECLSSLLERLVKDYRQFHSGLPDLFVWDFKKKKVICIVLYLSYIYYLIFAVPICGSERGEGQTFHKAEVVAELFEASEGKH